MNRNEKDWDVQSVEEQDDMFETENDIAVNVDRFSEAVIWGTDWTTETIARQLEKGAIDLAPSFQRRDAWTNKEKSKLIESLMLGLPVPPIILAENKARRNSYIVIDGKQRLLSIRRFFTKEDNECGFKPLKLSGLDILSTLNGKSYEHLVEEQSTYIDNLENQTIRTIVIKNWPDDAFLYTVFLRLNTGSKKLSPQELRQALIPGPFLDYLDDATADSEMIRRMLGNTNPDSRMKDVELALRYFGFKWNLEDYDGNLKKFLDETCKKINDEWENVEERVKDSFVQLEKSISFCYELFGNDSPFSRYTDKGCNNRFNKNIFELLTYYFSEENIRDFVRPKSKDFVQKFIEMNLDNNFLDAVSGTTKDVKKVCTRFQQFWAVLCELNNQNSEIRANHVELVNNEIVVKKRELIISND